MGTVIDLESYRTSRMSKMESLKYTAEKAKRLAERIDRKIEKMKK